jgi:hypothetical protein
MSERMSLAVVPNADPDGGGLLPALATLLPLMGVISGGMTMEGGI